MNDLKFALRQLLKNPGFTAVAVLTLALGGRTRRSSNSSTRGLVPAFRAARVDPMEALSYE